MENPLDQMPRGQVDFEILRSLIDTILIKEKLKIVLPYNEYKLPF